MIHLSQQLKLQQKLTPQQVQYLKLLQLPILALEQRLKTELETNPLLEEGMEDDLDQTTADETQPEETEQANGSAEEDPYSLDDFVHDESWRSRGERTAQDPEREDLPIPASVPMHQRLLEQLHLLDLDDEEALLGHEIIGNIDPDGYLGRDLELIVQDANLTNGIAISQEKAERVLKNIHMLDPPGIGARTLQECLIAQLEVSPNETRAKDLAIKVLRDHYDQFTLKHFEDLAKSLGISLDEVKRIFEVLQRLNPKPGEGVTSEQENYVIPDFTVHYEDGEFIIQLNDRSIPPLRINKG
ncbi:MAG: RNA polymerase sigma-54 factor, partial [Bacteroidota bacterium]